MMQGKHHRQPLFLEGRQNLDVMFNGRFIELTLLGLDPGPFDRQSVGIVAYFGNKLKVLFKAVILINNFTRALIFRQVSFYPAPKMDSAHLRFQYKENYPARLAESKRARI